MRYRLVQDKVGYRIEVYVREFNPREGDHNTWKTIFYSDSLVEAEEYITELQKEKQFPKILREFKI